MIEKTKLMTMNSGNVTVFARAMLMAVSEPEDLLGRSLFGLAPNCKGKPVDGEPPVDTLPSIDPIRRDAMLG